MPADKTFRAVLAAVSIATLCSIARAAEPPSTTSTISPEDLARQMIQATGGGDLGKQVMTQMIDAFRASNPKLPEAFWNEFLASVDPHQIEEMVVPIYVKNLTIEEMQAAIDFYSSPLGKSLIQKLPNIMQQSMAAGQEWGQHLAADAFDRITKYKQSHPDA